MTGFEKELIRVAEHGCPLCSSKTLRVSGERAFYCNITAPNGHIRHHNEAQDLPTYKRVQCENCMTLLGTVEDRWIPELQEVVKGE